MVHSQLLSQLNLVCHRAQSRGLAIMFLIYINDIVDNVSSYYLQYVCQFADNCLVYRVIQSACMKRTDIANLQSYLNTLAHWSHIWQDKCIAMVIKCTGAQTGGLVHVLQARC